MTLEERIKRYDNYLESFSDEEKAYAKERAEQFEINMTNLSEEVSQQASMFSYVANLATFQTKKRNIAKLEEKVTKARIRLEVKLSPPMNIPKPTVDDLGALVEKNEEVVLACIDTINQERLLDHLEADREALKQKSQMLMLLTDVLKRELMLKTGV